MTLLLWSVAAMVWMSSFHPLAVISAALVVVSCFLRDRLSLGRKGLGGALVVALAACFFTSRGLTPEAAGLYLGIGTFALALLGSWLLAGSMILRKEGPLSHAPLFLSGALLVACSMSVHLPSVAVIAGVGVLLLVFSLRESLGLAVSPRHLLPLLLTFILMASLSVAARWSETKLSYLMGLFSLIPPSGISFPTTTSLSALQRWNASDLVVLRGYGENPPLYLVGRTFSEFDDNNFWRWNTTKTELSPESQILLETSLGPRALSLFARTEEPESEPGPAFRLEYPRAGNGLTLYAPRDYHGVAADVSRLHQYSDGLLQVLAMDRLDGEYFLLPTQDGWTRRQSPQPLSTAEREEYLTLSSGVSPEVYRLAGEIAGEVNDPERKAEFITSYLQNNFTYGYDYPFESTATALEEFLIKRPPAHCEFFATAAALMLRTEGVPTRYVNGFVLQEKSLGGDYYVVRLKHAHAWVEAYIEGKGWITYDPTPPGTLADPEESRGLGSGLTEWFFNLWRRFINLFSLSPLEVLERIKLFLTTRTASDYAKLLALLALWWLWQRVRAKRGAPSAETASDHRYIPGRHASLTPTLDSVVRALRQEEWRRRPAETPEEWVGRLKGSGLEPDLLERLQTFVALYTRLRFGSTPHQGDLERLDSLRLELQEKLSQRELSEG